MTSTEIATRLNSIRRRLARPALAWCPACIRHTGTRRMVYALDECARCGWPRGGKEVR